jgi:hypothetical protein
VLSKLGLSFRRSYAKFLNSWTARITHPLRSSAYTNKSVVSLVYPHIEACSTTGIGAEVEAGANIGTDSEEGTDILLFDIIPCKRCQKPKIVKLAIKAGQSPSVNGMVSKLETLYHLFLYIKFYKISILDF